ncbi:MAG: Hsp70 family protein, partial [Megasphaera sp.]
GKEQKITIKSSSGLDKSEIDRMVKEAAAHEAEDKKRKEGIEAKNNADSLIYQAEKTIKDMGDKADAAKVSEIKDKIADLKEAVKSDDVDKIKAASEALTKPLYDLTSEMYKNADAASQQAQPEGGSAQSDAGESQKQDDNVVDADYTVVDDDKK